MLCFASKSLAGDVASSNVEHIRCKMGESFGRTAIEIKDAPIL